MSEKRNPYMYGNTARQMEPARRYNDPQRTPNRPQKKTVRKQNPKVSRQVARNRERMAVMSGSYVIFLGIAAICVMIACVSYLKLQSNIATRSSHITSLQRELAELKMENDAALGAVDDLVDLETVKIKADELGMVYLNKEQVLEYKSPTTDYVKQYETIPESGILPQSDMITE